MIPQNHLVENSSLVKNKLLQGLGFELRTLLNGFAGPIQLLKNRVENPELVDIFRLIDSSLSRLEELSIRSSMVSKIDTFHFPLKLNLINVVDIARYSILELQPIANLENIRFEVKSQPPDFKILGDYDMLKQVFEILLETAISLSEENSTINIHFLDDKSCIKCTITSSTAILPLELSHDLKQMATNEDVSWNLLMIKQLLTIHDAEIRIIEENINVANSLEITFKKHLE